MIQLIVLIILAAATAYFLRIRIEKIIPIEVMWVILITYLAGLFMGLVAAVIIATLSACLVVTGIVLLRIKKEKCVFSKENMSFVLTPQLGIALIVCLGMFVLYSGHIVIHWDDLNVWGIYPKTLFTLNKIPSGLENCSVTYKDYQPLQQILQYYFICGMKSFSEERLFQINVCFMYILLLPILDKFSSSTNKIKKAVVVIMYIIFPHVFTTQFYYKLGVDYLISILFGLSLYYIIKIFCEKAEALEDVYFTNNMIYRISLIITLSYLTIIKNSGIVLALLLLLIMCVLCADSSKGAVSLVKSAVSNLFIMGIVPLCFYMSFRIFARCSGNTGYMSDTINTNVRTLVHSFPEYTKEVLLHYVKNVFTYALTREKFGITAIIIIALIAIIQFLLREGLPKKLIIAGWVGFGLFVIGHIYMYLFVFDEWEAHGLMEYDRYICQYLAGMLLCYILLLLESNVSAFVPMGIVVLFIALFPYKAAYTNLIPSNYDRMVEIEHGSFIANGKREWESCGIKDMNIPNDEEHRIMLITNAWDDSIMHFTFAAVPQVLTCYANIPAVEEGNLRNYLGGQIEDRHIRYVYVCENAKESFAGDFDLESSEITDDGRPLSVGIYEVTNDYMLHRIDK